MAKKKKSSAFAVVQQIGKSFFLPVSVLPIAGILLGLGSSFTNADTIAAYHLQGIMGEGTILNALLTIMSQVGNTIFGNLPLIFALAVALGMAKNEKAVAVLSAGILYSADGLFLYFLYRIIQYSFLKLYRADPDRSRFRDTGCCCCIHGIHICHSSGQRLCSDPQCRSFRKITDRSALFGLLEPDAVIPAASACILRLKTTA